MALNIKDPRVHELAQQAARVTGKSQTRAIEEGLVLLLRSYDTDPDEARIRTVVDSVWQMAVDYRADAGRANPEITSVDDLFDDAGMPR